METSEPMNWQKEVRKWINLSNRSLCTLLKRITVACLRSEVKCRQKAKADGKRWQVLVEPGGRVPPNLTRRDGVACFRLLTGHDYLQAHLCRIGLAVDPTCTLCGREDMSSEHLVVCPSIEDIRSLILSDDIYRKKALVYWEARRRMAELP
uniref:Reverse transcriptase zinc-binding domain-containing protein n=1 Tax=Rhodnius prolixus TaxID=13249 RepID=T1I318_RHOPR